MKISGCFLIFSCSLGALANEEIIAIQKINYSVGPSFARSTIESLGKINAASFDGNIRTPLYKMLGVSIGASISHQNIKLSSFDNSCSGNTQSGYGALILRNPKLGQISADYNRSEAFACFSDGSIKKDTYSIYSLSGSYFLDNISLSGGAYGEEASHLSSYKLGVNYYANPNNNLAFGLRKPKADHLVYALNYTTQPEWVHNAISLSAGYSYGQQKTSSGSDTINSHDFTIGLKYYFGNDVGLKTRDRYY